MAELPYLRKLMGDAWIDAEVFGEKPEHLLGQYQRNEQARVWLKHTEELIEELLTNPKIKFDARVIADKIKDPFISTLAEIESAAFLAQQGFSIVLEPNAPAVGPDIRADWHGVSYFIEVRSAGLAQDEDRHEAVTKEIFARLNATPSAYSASFVIGDEYTAGSCQTGAAIDLVVEVLSILKKDQIKKATLYYVHPKGKVLLREGVRVPGDKADEIVHNASFVVRFEDRGQEMAGTPASAMKKTKLPLEPVKDHERLKKILQNKRKQLPKSSRGIITLEVTEQFMLSDFSVEAALYGDLVVQFKPVKSPQEEVGELIPSRNNRGFFRKTSRVSAIVFQRRRLEAGRVVLERKVYPTNRANADTIRLTLAELQRLGDIENRDHLTAEHAPNHVDENMETDIPIDAHET